MLLIICFILEYYNDNFILVGNKNLWVEYLLYVCVLYKGVIIERKLL